MASTDGILTTDSFGDFADVDPVFARAMAASILDDAARPHAAAAHDLLVEDCRQFLTALTRAKRVTEDLDPSPYLLAALLRRVANATDAADGRGREEIRRG